MSANLQPRAGSMLKELSGRLGLQFIMVTHSETLVGSADRVLQVRMRKGVTKVEEG